MKNTLPRLEAGKPIPADTINRFIEAVETASEFSVAGGLDYRSGASGGSLGFDGVATFEAKLSGSSSPYSWTEVQLNRDTDPPTWTVLTGARSGTTNAHEYNASVSLDGLVVELTQVGGNWFKFPHPRKGPPPPCDATITGVIVSCSRVTIVAVGPNGATRTLSNVLGSFTIPRFDGDGSYSVTISGGGVYGRTLGASLTCTTGANLGTIYMRPTSVTVTVSAKCATFSNPGVKGAVVTLTGDIAGSCTIVSGNSCTVTTPDVAGTGSLSGTITVTMDRYASVSQSWTGIPPCSPALALTVTTDCYTCCPGYPYPISFYFALTTPLGNVVIPPNNRASFFANVLAHPASGLPTCPALPSCCPNNSSGFLGNCGCTNPVSVQTVEFAAGTSCVPNTALYFRGCASSYPNASADLRNGFSQGFNVLWDRSSRVEENGGFFIEGDNASGAAGYFDGHYTLTELPCDYMSGGLMMASAPAWVGSSAFPAGEPSADRVRVGHLAPCLNQGGAEAWMVSLAKSVDPAKVSWRGAAITRGEGDTHPEMVRRLGELMPVGFGREAAIRLARDCDVLITWAIDGLPEILADVGPNPPKVISAIHAPPESPWGQTVYARPEGVDQWVAVSELALQALPAASAAAAPTATIWNAVDGTRMVVGRSRAEMRAAWGVPLDARVVGYLGRLSGEKDPHAMARLAPHLPGDWHAVVVGAGAEKLAPHPRLHLVGPDNAAGDVLNAFDHLVVPSYYESFGLTIAEGWSAGVPVISTDSGIAKIIPGMTKLIPIKADGPTIARALLDDRADMRALAERTGAARVFARERLGQEEFGKSWTDMIVKYRRDPVSYPGVFAMAGNLIKSAAAHAAGGFREAPEVVQEARAIACRACPLWDGEIDACRKCGCGSVVRGGLAEKRKWAASVCPDEPPRWDAC